MQGNKTRMCYFCKYTRRCGYNGTDPEQSTGREMRTVAIFQSNDTKIRRDDEEEREEWKRFHCFLRRKCRERSVLQSTWIGMMASSAGTRVIVQR